MKHNNINILLAILMSMVGIKVSAYDIAVENADGVTLYYNYINDGTELEVTYRGINAWDEYEGTRAAIINIPDTVTYHNRKRAVTKIGDYSFSYGYTKYSSNNTTTTVTIPNTVREIGRMVFYNCKVLKSITIPNSVKKIGGGTFIGCKNLNVYISDIASWCTIEFAPEWEWSGPYDSNPLQFAKKLYLNGEEITNLIIPDGVETIGKYAFYGCSFLQAVTFPNSVTNIGIEAFYNCTNLTAVTFPNSGVTNIGENAFLGCTNLTKVIISDLVAWCNINFYNPYSNPLIYAHNLYLNNEKITKLTIPNSVTTIKNNTFYACSCLTSITIHNSVKSIGHGAFCLCNRLTSIDIPNSVTSIGDWTFGSSGLKTIIIPNSVTSIGNSAFSGCSNLYTIVSLNKNPFELNQDPFDYDQYMNSSLYVPIGTIDKYKSTEGWKQFIWMEEGIPTGIKEEKVTNDEINWFSLDGMKLESAKKGINIIRHANGKTSKVFIK